MLVTCKYLYVLVPSNLRYLRQQLYRNRLIFDLTFSLAFPEVSWRVLAKSDESDHEQCTISGLPPIVTLRVARLINL